MTPTAVVPRELVAEHLAVSTRLLVRYEALGLVQAVRAGNVEGYEPGEIRRLWSIVSLQRDLGVNLAGVEAVLKLQAHVSLLHRQLTRLAEQLHTALESDLGSDEN